MSDLLIGFIGIAGTIGIYLLSVKLHEKYNNPFTAPVVIATIVLIVVLLVFHTNYDTYMVGGDWINKLLGPAVVALAYPLYMEREMLKKIAVPAVIGTFTGSLIGVTTGVILVKWAGFGKEIIYSIASKNVTTPVSMGVATSVGGSATLAAVFVMIAGIGGVLIYPFVFKLFRINHFLGRGLGFGSASHAVGTAEAMESSQREGSISTIAMVLCAVMVSIITPGLITLFV